MAVHAEVLPGTCRENSAKVVWALAWPAVALNSLQVMNTLLDRWFTGSLTPSALTGYGGSLTFTFLMFALAMSVATAATALVSRAFGAGDQKEWKESAQQSLSITILCGIAAAIILISGARTFAATILPNTDPLAIQEMSGYLLCYGLGLPAIFVIQTLAGSLRGTGDTRSPMYISGVQILLHIGLNFIFIFPPRHYGIVPIPGLGLGLRGAALALATSSWVSAVGYLIYMRWTAVGRLRIDRLPQMHWSLRVFRIAIPAGMASSLRVFSLALFTLILKQTADASAAIAAMSIGFALESIMFMPAFGLSAAATALVGQSLGMKQPDRAERLAWTAGNHGGFVTLCLAGPLFVFAPSLAISITHGKPDIASDATLLIRSLCATEVLFGYAMVMIGAMQGAGDTVRPLWITIVCLLFIRIPAATILALPHSFKLAGLLPLPFAMGLGALGAWLAMSATQGLQGILAMLAFKRGHWKIEKV